MYTKCKNYFLWMFDFTAQAYLKEIKVLSLLCHICCGPKITIAIPQIRFNDNFTRNQITNT